jgi:hypothetical protein
VEISSRRRTNGRGDEEEVIENRMMQNAHGVVAASVNRQIEIGRVLALANARHLQLLCLFVVEVIASHMKRTVSVLEGCETG